MERNETGRFIAYWNLRLKRALRLLPPVLGLSLLLLLAVGLLALAAGTGRGEDQSRQRIDIGVTVDPEDRLLNLGLTALENFDRSRLALELVPVTEAEAEGLLRRGALDACLVIPEGFITALERGETRPIRYVSAGGAGLGQALTDELVRMVAALLLETENAVYGAQRYAMEALPETDPYALGDRLSRSYLSAILNRDDLYVTETLGLAAGLSFGDYYACALPLLFLLLWGILAAPVFSEEPPEARRVLAAAGFGAVRQLVCEYLAYVPLLLVCYGAALGLVLLAGAALPSLGALLPASLPDFALRAAVPALVFAAMQMLFFELGAGSVGALLLQFLAAAAMAFVSGCFYPSSMLPPGLQKLGALLPAGAGLAWCAAPSWSSLGLLALWLLIFAGLLWLARRRGEEGGR